MRRVLVLSLLAASLVGCAGMEPNLLGGRTKCWDASEKRLATLMKGWVELDTDPPVMHTPEGDDFGLTFPFLVVKPTENGPVLVDGRTVVASNGELITVFGGLGSSGSIAVCGVEEHHDGNPA
jgi:hypothetical protein